MRLIDADKLPVKHGVFTPVGGNIRLQYDAVMLEDIEKAPTEWPEEGTVIGIDLAPVKPEKIMRIGAAERGLYYCGWCHRRISRQDRFCRECGNRIDWSENTEK